jgi:hypothetical protein
MSAGQALPVAMAVAAGLALGWALGERSARRQAAAMYALLDRALEALARTYVPNRQTAGGFGGAGGASSTPPCVTHAKGPPQTPFAAVLEGVRKMPPGAGSEPDCVPADG